MLNANAPEFFVSSTAFLPTYCCFSYPSDWCYQYAHWYQASPYPYGPHDPNVSSLRCVEGMVDEARTRSSRSRRRTVRNGKVVVSHWRPKSKPSKVVNVKVPTLFEFKEEVAEDVGKTTVMIRNIPNKYSRNMLIDLLDKHCAEVNKKIASLGGEKEKQPPSTYDFVYLPMDFKSRCNLGYAFVNFTTPIATSRLYRYLHKSRWQDFCSKKICQITYARIQGKRALKAHFYQSSFACDSDEYLPVEFVPPRDGFCASVGVTSGKRVSRP